MPVIIAAWDAGYDAILRNAPALAVAYSPKEAPNGMVDLTLALSYFDLVAPTMELGTCWDGGRIPTSHFLKTCISHPIFPNKSLPSTACTPIHPVTKHKASRSHGQGRNLHFSEEPF